MKTYKVEVLKDNYKEKEFKELLNHLNPDDYRYNTGYKCWIIIDDEGYPVIYINYMEGLYTRLTQLDYSLNGYNSTYVRVVFPRKNATRYNEEMVHRLVHYAWTSESTRHDRNLVIDHIDGNIYNNNPSNLRMVTIKENNNNRHNLTQQDKDENKRQWLNHTSKVLLVFTED